MSKKLLTIAAMTVLLFARLVVAQTDDDNSCTTECVVAGDSGNSCSVDTTLDCTTTCDASFCQDDGSGGN